MSIEFRRWIIAALFMGQLARASSALSTFTCESLLTSFSGEQNPKKISSAIIDSIKSLQTRGILSAFDLAQLGANIASSADGLALSSEDIQNRNPEGWAAATRLLSLVREKLASRKDFLLLQTQLKSDWKALSDDFTTEHEAKAFIVDGWQYRSGFRVVKEASTENNGSNAFSELYAQPNDPYKFIAKKGANEHVLFDFSGHEPQENDLPALDKLDTEYRVLAPNLFFAKANDGRYANIFSYDFSDPSRPKLISHLDAIKKSDLHDILTNSLTRLSIKTVYEVSPGHYALVVGWWNSEGYVGSKIYNLDTKAETTNRIYMDQRHPEAILKLIRVNEHSVFGFGNTSHVAKLDFASPKWSENLEVHWSEYEYFKQSHDNGYAEALALTTGEVVTWGKGQTSPVLWSMGEPRRGQELLSGLSDDAGVEAVFEMAPHKILVVNRNRSGVLWDIANTKFPISRNYESYSKFGNYQLKHRSVQFADGSVLSFVGGLEDRGSLLYSKLNERGEWERKDIPFFVDEEMEDTHEPLEVKLLPTRDGDAVLFSNRGVIAYVELGANPKVTHLKNFLGDPLSSKTFKSAQMLPNGNIVVLTRSGQIVEFSYAALKNFARMQP